MGGKEGRREEEGVIKRVERRGIGAVWWWGWRRIKRRKGGGEGGR